MKNKNDIKEELSQLGIHIPSSTMPNMQIPEAYFDTLPDSIFNYIQQLGDIDLLPKYTPFEMPNGYFENFSSMMIESIHQEQFVDSLPKSMPYFVNENYFTELPNRILAGIHQRNNGLLSTNFSRRFIARIALAATLLLFMGLSLKMFLRPENTLDKTISVENQLATISDGEINQYLLHHQTEIESNLVLENIDESKLDLQKLESEIFDHSLNSVSDEELINYTL